MPAPLPYVQCVPGREPLADGIRIVDKNREGQLRTLTKVLRVALNNSSPNEPITILEDDAEVPPGFMDYVAFFHDWIRRYDHAVQWFWPGASWSPVWGAQQTFVHRPAGKFFYTIAATYSRSIAEALYKDLSLVAEGSPDLIHRGDEIVTRSLWAQRRDFLLHWPPIAQHMGEQSIANPGYNLDHRYRLSPYYSRNNAAEIVKRRPFPSILYPGEYEVQVIAKSKEP